ncbi:putative peroxiredoxin-like 2A/B/C, Thioredoxin-like superfamily [Helianthus annuus]|nr:putative peroxiredoxin-like 2A/B/C, Thioredoxin-like superfamily [Helianthus annuus]
MLAALSPSPSPAPLARGTSQTSIETGSLLERVEVFDLNGNSVLISDLWKDRKVVVAFARHFGCVLCMKRADLLAAKKDRMDASGVALVLIGPGSVDQAVYYLMGQIYCLLLPYWNKSRSNELNVVKSLFLIQTTS